jgi:hypothetical protein
VIVLVQIFTNLQRFNFLGGGAVQVGRAIWVFLVRPYFAAKTLAYDGWIHLDFLGLSRPN